MLCFLVKIQHQYFCEHFLIYIMTIEQCVKYYKCLRNYFTKDMPQ